MQNVPMIKDETRFKRDFGGRLSELRRNYKDKNGKSMSQEKLAELLDTDSKKISRIENGNKMVSPSYLQHLSQIFNVSIDYLITGKEYDYQIEQLKKLLCDIESQIKLFRTKNPNI